ncbi:MULTISPECIES: toxic anion resistance protein [unclassified Acinetobacter]|uniref:toxic anion resistance protein n=1 Tax=unclassified Acinetobacter TaxID=196816 RepID=UPI002934B533|nr:MULTISPECIES: toxic anion resistance protein [unclassified Acinetobacter]WOE31689.1 toxic anion resistance protein [Acinetobacter sp. SAAs470]WOE37154.1 toxic anion resistance protein [Acinetobacter sp. SAAs474]
MTNSEHYDLMATMLSAEQSKEKFEQLDLAEIGLETTDFEQVLAVQQDLQQLSYQGIAEYGKNIAKQTSDYTDELLNLVQNKELESTGQKLTEVVQVAQQLNSSNLLNPTKSSGFLGKLINKMKGAKQNFAMEFSTTKQQLDLLIQEVEASQAGLKSRVDTLEKMFSAVEQQYKQLGIYIAAGKIKQYELQNHLKKLSDLEQSQTIVQKIYDLNHLANTLEKRLSDFQILQQSAMQSLPMIRIIQSNNIMLIDKFYAIKNITIPAWKNQISLAISLTEQKNSVELANHIDEATNDILRRNADLLHQNSIDTARANQRSVIDVATLEHVQNTLINTVNDVIKIQKEGVQKRLEATERLKQLQQNLNQLVIESQVTSSS